MISRFLVLGSSMLIAVFVSGLIQPRDCFAISHHRREVLRRTFGHHRGITPFPNNGFLHPVRPFRITGPYPVVGGYNRVRAYIYDRSYDPDSFLGRRNRFISPAR